MGAEIKTNGVKMETKASKNLHAKFTRRCKNLNVSVAQRLRDLMQMDIKNAKR